MILIISLIVFIFTPIVIDLMVAQLGTPIKVFRMKSRYVRKDCPKDYGWVFKDKYLIWWGSSVGRAGEKLKISVSMVRFHSPPPNVQFDCCLGLIGWLPH